MIEIVVQFSEILLGVASISGIAIIFAATIYDLRKVTQKKLYQTTVKNLGQSDQPSIAVVVLAFNGPSRIIDCLTSITASRYVNYQIVIVCDVSDDMTKEIIATYKRHNKNTRLTVCPTKMPTSRTSIFHMVRDKLRGSELIFTVDATDKLTPNLLINAAACFVSNEKLTALRLRPVDAVRRDITSLPHQFFRMSKNMLYKAIARRAVRERHYHEPGIIVRSSILNLHNSPDKPQADYDSALLLISPLHAYHSQPSAKPSIAAALTLIATLAALAMMSYFLYTAAILQSNMLLTLGWILVVLWLLIVIWSDDAISRTTKLELSMTVPFMYFVFYVFLIIHAYRIIAKGISAILLSRLSIENLYDAFQIELYSTRY